MAVGILRSKISVRLKKCSHLAARRGEADRLGDRLGEERLGELDRLLGDGDRRLGGGLRLFRGGGLLDLNIMMVASMQVI